MQVTHIIIDNNTGIHARPAKELVNISKGFTSDIKIKKGDKSFNTKSMISILKAGLSAKSEIDLEISGEDEEKAMETLQDFFNNLSD